MYSKQHYQYNRTKHVIAMSEFYDTGTSMRVLSTTVHKRDFVVFTIPHLRVMSSYRQHILQNNAFGECNCINGR